MLAELQALADAAFDPEDEATPTDYVVSYVASGGILNQLAEKLRVSRHFLTDTLRKMEREAAREELHPRLVRARLEGAHALAEEANTLVDNVIADKEEILKAKLRAERRERLAGAWNRQEFGQDKGQVSVAINLPGLHLAALQAIKSEGTTDTASVALPRVSADDSADYEIIEDKHGSTAGAPLPLGPGETPEEAPLHGAPPPAGGAGATPEVEGLPPEKITTPAAPKKRSKKQQRDDLLRKNALARAAKREAGGG